MKSLSLTTPRVIFLLGIPGAGKTFFAKKFSETFSAPFVEAEAIRYTISEEPSFTPHEQHAVDIIAENQLKELLKTKKTILYEGGLESRAARTRLAKLVRESGYEPMFVWVQTEPATAKQRATRGVRSQNSTQTYTISETRYEQLVNRFTAPNESEKAVVISGKHTYASQAKIILKRLAAARQQAAEDVPLQVPSRPAPRRSGNIKII